MKKILLYTAAIAVLASCSEVLEDVAPIVSGDTKEVSVGVAIDYASRVSVEDDWSVTWDDGDALLAIGKESGGSSKFSMTNHGDVNSTFSGTLNESDTEYRLLYPYSDSYTIKNSSINVSLSSQTKGATATYMSSDAVVASVTGAKLEHCGGVIELVLEGLNDVNSNDYSGWTINSVEVDGFSNSAAIPVDGDSEGGATQSLARGEITITDGSTRQSSETSVSLLFNIFPTTLNAGDEVNVRVSLTNSDQSTTVELAETIEVTSTLEFKAGEHNKVTCDALQLSNDGKYWTDERIVATAFSDNSAGTSDDPIMITTAAEFALIAKRVNTEDEQYENTFFKLANNIDLTGHKWDAIGNGPEYFKGTFDGDNKSISGLYVSENDHFQALFGVIKAATIKNVSVVDGYVKGNLNVGGIVGCCYGSPIITNCHFSGDVKSTSNTVGGIVGKATGSVTNCYNSADVISSGTANIGGVVGSTTGSVTNCYNSGYVRSNGRAGGVVGYNSGTVTNCYNSGVVSGSDAKGVVGENYFSGSPVVENCYYLSDTAVDSKATPKTDGEMKGTEFLGLLNSNAKSYNDANTSAAQACGWTAVTNGYPSLDYTKVPE